MSVTGNKKENAWSKIEAIFDGALGVPASARASYVSAACKGDRDLEKEVLSLIAAHDESSKFLSQSPATHIKNAIVAKASNLNVSSSASLVSRQMGKYTLLRRLGAGGMAEIFQAVVTGDGGFERNVALKSLLPALTGDSSLHELFENEARINSLLTHSNIAQVFDFFQAEGRYFLSMEFVNGKNLRQIREKVPNGKISHLASCYIVSEVAKGLAYAHNMRNLDRGVAHGIIHRDISPKNIMVSYDGEVKIVDFGIAKAREKLAETRSVTLKGTFRYMSPEQAMGHAVDHRSDIFSTGLVLYEILTGKSIFTATEIVKMLDEVRNYSGVEDALANEDFPGEFKEILVNSLAAKPEDRYASAEDMHRALQVYLVQNFSGSAQLSTSSWLKNLFHEEIASEVAELKLASERASNPPPPPLERTKDTPKPPMMIVKAPQAKKPAARPPAASPRPQPRLAPPPPRGSESHLMMYLVAILFVGIAGFLASDWYSRRTKVRAVPAATLSPSPQPAVPVPPPPEPTPVVVSPPPAPVVSVAPPPEEPVVEKPKASRPRKAKSAVRINVPLSLSAPDNAEEFIENSSSNGITFSWTGRPLAKGEAYRIEISQDADFSTSLAAFESMQTRLTNEKLKLTAGTYFWRVGIYDSAGTRLEASKAFTFVIRPQPRLLPPKSNIIIRGAEGKSP